MTELNDVKVIKRKIDFSFLKNIHSLFYYVLFLILIGIGFFAFALFRQSFTIPLGGDYTQQYVAFHYNFYDDWWTFFTTGKFVLWDHNTFLGADNITSNTYYGLFSPFLLPILFFPRSWIPQLMAIMMIARMVVGGLFFRLYLKHFKISETSARVFSIAYAFCGWMAYYLWFNNFFEVLTFLPLVLLGIEKVLTKEKPTLLIVALFLFGISNYFFLITISFYGVAYALFRFFQRIKLNTAKENLAILGWGILAFAIGIMLGFFILLPNYLNAMQAPRAEDATYLASLKEAWEIKDYEQLKFLILEFWGNNNNSEPATYRQLYPFLSFLFPTISGRYVNLIPLKNFENISGSIFTFTPTIMLFFVGVYNSFKKRKFSHFIPIIFFIFALFTPFFYYAFHAFTVMYSRWQIIVVISLITYAALNFDERKNIPSWVSLTSFIITLTLMLVAYRLAVSIESEQVKLLSEQYWVFFYQIVVCISTGIVLFINWRKEYLSKILMGTLALEAVVMGNFVMNFHGVISYKDSLSGGHENYTVETEIIKNLNEYDNSFYRVQSTRAYLSNDNLPAVENFNGTSTFHSLYNFDVIDFVRMSHIFKHDTSWIGGAQEKRYNLDAFLGVKYYLFKESETTFYKDGERYVFDMNVPLGYTRLEQLEKPGYRLYQNDEENYISLGFTYDTLYYKNPGENRIYNDFHTRNNHSFDVIRNEEAYLKGAILENEDIESILDEYSHFNTSEAPTLDAKRIYTKKTLYDTDFYFNPFQPDLYLDGYETFPFSEASTKVVRDKTQLVITPTSGKYITTQPSYLMIRYPLKMPATDYRGRIYLIGDGYNENGELDPTLDRVLTTDYHNNNEAYQKYYRGFYATEPVKKIIIVPAGTGIVYPNTEVYVESWSDIQNKLANLKQYPLTDIISDTNYFSFKTNFSEERFVITQVAYGSGWQVYAKNSSQNEKLQTFNAQGGFVGFVSKKGETTYEMKYFTPYLSTGLIVTFSGLALFGGSVALWAFVDLKKKKNIIVEED